MVRINIIPQISDEEKSEPQKKPELNKSQNGIEDFLSKLKFQEKEVEQKRMNTLRQLEKIKQEIQKSIKEDREERQIIAQEIGGHYMKNSYMKGQAMPTQLRDNRLFDVMSITSGTEFSQSSLVTNTQFVGIYK